jgi:glyceraldehyde 3-phosphate dehydrogenase
MAKVGITGFGRIGRLTLRRAIEQPQQGVEVAVINELSDTETNAQLFKYDSNYGTFPGTVKAGNGFIEVNGKNIKVLAEKDPAKIPWRDFGVDLVIECTGVFTDAPKAALHLQGGAKKVLISAPSKGEDITICLGVNGDKYDPAKHKIISNASCTTNALAPIVKVLNDSFGIKHGLLNTVHSYTNDQRVLDQAHKDWRRARNAATNIIPTSTGAARTVTVVIPELKGKLDGVALRIPTPTVSIVDFTAELNKPVTVEQVNSAMKAAAEGPMKGILVFTTDLLVSSDFKGSTASCIVDSDLTAVMDGTMVKVFGWYDNEWGYTCRLVDAAAMIIKKGL